MNPTTTTTTGSNLTKNDFRYLPLMSTALDGVIPLSIKDGSATGLPVGATAAIATPSGALVHVIPVQLAPATATPSTALVNLTNLAVNSSSPMASAPMNILTTPKTDIQQVLTKHAIPLNSESINLHAAAVTELKGNGYLPTSSIIGSERIPTNIDNMSTSQAAATSPATFIPTSSASMATSCCQITNDLSTSDLYQETVKKVVIGCNATNGTNTATTTSLIKAQLPKHQYHHQQQLQKQQPANAPILQNQLLLNATEKISTNTAAVPKNYLSIPQQRKLALPPPQHQITTSMMEQQKVVSSLSKTQQLESSVAQVTPTNDNKKQQISNKNLQSASSIPLNSNAVPLKSNITSSTTTPTTASEQTAKVKSIPSASFYNDKPTNDDTDVTLDPKSGILMKNNKKDSTSTIADVTTQISNAVTLTLAKSMSVIKTAPSPAKVTLEEIKVPATEQKQESLLKAMKRVTKQYTSPRSKRSKSLNSETLGEATITTAAERRFSSTDAHNKIKVNIQSNPRKKNDTTFILIAEDDDDYDEGDINLELAGFDEEYLEDTNSDEKSSDFSEFNIEIAPSSVKDESPKKDNELASEALKINKISDQNDNLAENLEIKQERVAIIDFARNTVEMEEIKLNEPLVKCKQEVMDEQELQQTFGEPLDKSLFCDEQLIVTSSTTASSSTSSPSTSSAFIKNDPAKINTSPAKKSPTTQSLATFSTSSSSSISPTLPSAPVAAHSENSGYTNLDINSYSTVLSMLSTFNMLSWKERIGTARGTSLRFQLNEFNLLQIHERCQPRYRIHTAYEKPIYEREAYSIENTDPSLYLCRRCNCHGRSADFLAPEYCSLECLKRNTRKRQRDVTTTTRKRPRKDTIASAAVAILTDTSSATQQTTAASSNSNNSLSLLVRRSIFRWSTYLTGKFGELPAPVSLFLNPFPTGPNNFQIGMKLEAIDPENCSLFCVCTVVDIQGYRLNLNFDGYDRMYNFWVNADSMDIFPPGWCAKTNRILQPPKGLDAAMFNWTSYLVKEQAVPAPRQLFTHLNSSSLPTRNPFKVGMHLEAEDLNDTGKLCVATVADVLDERIRIHFDGWDDCYDYWVDTDSPYIHPCGWHEGRHQLVVPPDFEDSAFAWSDYIKERRSNLKAPTEIFAARSPIEFKPKMKLEVVDPRNPILIRPATVVACKGHRVKIHLDQWPIDYCFWLEDDSPDLHPIGWCDATKHDLEPPPGYLARTVVMPCSIVGCRGIGNARAYGLNMHCKQDSCPYAAENWNIKKEKPPRVDGHEIERKVIAKVNSELTTKRESREYGLKAKQKQLPTLVPISSSNKSSVADDIIERLRLLDNIKTRRSLQEKLQHSNTSSQVESIDFEKQLDIKLERKATMEVDEYEDKQKIKVGEPVKLSKANALHFPVDAAEIQIAKEYLCDYGPRLQQNYNIWQRNLNFNSNDIKKNPLRWTTAECCLYVEKILNFKSARTFANEDIDGAALLALHQSDLTDILDLKLGPAAKLYAHILQLRTFYAKMEKLTLKNLS